MRWCTRCVLPDTRPNLGFDDEGVCSACRGHGRRPSIDWDARHAQFVNLVDDAKARGARYDCIIPVSGGKDSTWQVITCLEHGLRPLAVTWKTPGRTAIGPRNLDNLVSLGVDHIDYQINPQVERRLMLAAFERFGSTAVPMHMAIFAIPAKIAVRFGIPLIVWGENSAFEYGGREEERTGFRLDSAWLKRHGVTHGTTAADWVSDRFSRRELTPYFGPSEDELQAAGVLAVFLGYYLEWDPETTRKVAAENGFVADAGGPRTGLYHYADIDDDFISIHHLLKWYKFGLTRLFDTLSRSIRTARITRDNPKGGLLLAHGLKGSARSVGAFAIAECAVEIETDPRDSRALARLARLIDEVRDFIAAISR